MVRESYILLFLYVFAVNTNGQDSIRFSGQFSSWANINNGSDFPLWGGVRYIPQLNYSTRAVSVKKFDTELSANIFGSAGLHPFDTLSASGNIKPYRVWVRYSSEQLELRLGLQKINFGSASMLRPLMWFDQIDPRDPLQLTDGVWGFLARYYFLNNANLWLWALYGNSDRKGWEVVPVNKRIPEYGGRIQLPVEKGEIGLSYHHRVADSRELGSEFNSYDKIPENRIGFDAKWDLKTGIWLEGSYTNKRRDIGIYTNQFAVNAGIDYTFSVGNGLYMAFEQLLAAYDEKPFSFSNNIIYSLLMFNYPIGLFDRLSAIIYYNWSEETVYTFINWQKQFDKIILYVMAYWNPESLQLPAQSAAKNIFAGKGIQLMFVFNH